MTDPTQAGLWECVAQVVAEKTGLHFSPERRGDLERGIRAALPELGCSGIQDCLVWLTTAALSRRHIEVLAERLTIGETYFFRDEALHTTLRTSVLSRLINERASASKSLRIWSAGCCTGEEPYSIAILLREMMGSAAEWNISLLATDINRRFLNSATTGTYTQWSFRDTPPEIRERHFRKTDDGKFTLNPEIRRMVEFTILNLVENVYPSIMNNTNAMDLILCRNVLMYFSMEQAAEVVRRLFRSLAEGGWLIVSPTETSSVLFSMFRTVQVNGQILYQKDSKFQPVERLLSAPVIQPEIKGIEYPDSELFTRKVSPYSQPAPTPAEAGNKAHAEADGPLSSFNEALSLYKSGDFKMVVGKLVPGMSRGDENAEAMVLLARSYANLGMLMEARMWCESAIRADKLNPGYNYLLGAIFQELGEPAEAERAFNRALYIDPRYVLASFSLGNLARGRGDPEDSLKHFEYTLRFLKTYQQDEILPGSDGMTAGRLTEIIRIFI